MISSSLINPRSPLPPYTPNLVFLLFLFKKPNQPNKKQIKTQELKLKQVDKSPLRQKSLQTKQNESPQKYY